MGVGYPRSKSTWTCARATPCASSRPRLLQGAQARQGRDPQCRTARRGSGRGRASRVGVSHPSTVHQRRGRLTMPSLPREELEDWVERWLEANRDAETDGRLEAAGRLLHRRRHLRLEHRPQGRRDVRRHATRSATSHWAWRWRAWRTGSTSTRRCSSTRSRARSSASGSRSSTRPTARADEIYGIGGSWFRLNDNLQDRVAARLLRLRPRVEAVHEADRVGRPHAGMQKRIERGMAGEKLPGYYPLGEAPVADLVAPTQAVAWGPVT